MPLEAVKCILEAHRNYEFFGGLVKGPLRVGKSSYSIQVLAEAYGTPENPDWDAWKKYLVYKPEEFAVLCDWARKARKQKLLIVWDDAGFWLSAYEWHKDLVKAVSKYMNVIATLWASVLFTAPGDRWIITKVRYLPGGHRVNIAKLTGNPYQRNLRRARWYKRWVAPDEKKSGVRVLLEDIFNVNLPNKVFYEYDSYRREYSDEAQTLLDGAIKTLRKSYGENVADNYKRTFEDLY